METAVVASQSSLLRPRLVRFHRLQVLEELGVGREHECCAFIDRGSVRFYGALEFEELLITSIGVGEDRDRLRVTWISSTTCLQPATDVPRHRADLSAERDLRGCGQ